MPDEKKAKRRNHPDVVLAHAQITLTFVLLVAIVALVFCLVFFHNQMGSQAVFSMISGTIVSLVTLLTLSWNYFFSRQRPPTLPETPNNNGATHAPISTGGSLSVTHDDTRSPGGLG